MDIFKAISLIALFILLIALLLIARVVQHGISPVYAGSAANWLGLALVVTSNQMGFPFGLFST
jgi:hypothetical protein